MKRRLLNVITLLIASLLALVLGEVFLRIFYSPTLVNRQMTRFDPELGWRLVTGEYRVRRSASLISHTIRINRLGMRNPEVTLTPAPDCRRAVLLGDSFTFGMLVPEEALLARVAQGELERRRLDRGIGCIEVVNTGAQGYGTAQELLYMRWLHAQGFRADLYVVVFFLNDLLDNLGLSYTDLREQPVQPGFALDAQGNLYLAHRPEERLTRRGSLTRRRTLTLQPLLIDLLRNRALALCEAHSGLFRSVRSLGVRVELPRLPALVQAWYQPETLDRGWPLTCALLRAMRDEARAAGAELAVVALPSPFQIYETYRILIRDTYATNPAVAAFLADPCKPQRLLAEFCVQEDIPWADCEPALRTASGGAALFSSEDHHLSRRGHEIVGRALAEHIDRLLGAHSSGSISPAQGTVD